MHQRKTANGSGHSNNSITNNKMYSRTGSAGYSGRDLEGGRGIGRFNDTNSNILEQQNNERISELSEQVARLKVRLMIGVVVVKCLVFMMLADHDLRSNFAFLSLFLVHLTF
jgi:hypothetical protein